MKFSELSFKVITGTYKRNLTIIEKLKNLDVAYPSNIEDIKFVTICNHGSVNYNHDMERFDFVMRTEITFNEAIKMLENCEPELMKQSGKFVEYDIDENGCCYHPLNDRGSSTTCRWQDIHHYEDVNRIFAGWLFAVETKNQSGKRWSIHRLGLDRDDRMVSDAHDWVKPLVPTKIRFWVRNNI